MTENDAHQVRKSAKEFLERNRLRHLVFGGNLPFLTKTSQRDRRRGSGHPADVPDLIDVEVNAAIKNLSSFSELLHGSEKVSVKPPMSVDKDVNNDVQRDRLGQVRKDLSHVGARPLDIRPRGGRIRRDGTGLNDPELGTVVAPLHVLRRAVVALDAQKDTCKTTNQIVGKRCFISGNVSVENLRAR